MNRLTLLRKSISDKSVEEMNVWQSDLRTSRRTPKVIHKKKSQAKGGTKERKKRAPKQITTRSGTKAVANLLTKEQREKLAKELMGK